MAETEAQADASRFTPDCPHLFPVCHPLDLSQSVSTIKQRGKSCHLPPRESSSIFFFKQKKHTFQTKLDAEMQNSDINNEAGVGSSASQLPTFSLMARISQPWL